MADQKSQSKDKSHDEEIARVGLYAIGGLVALFLMAPILLMAAIFYPKAKERYPDSLWVALAGVSLLAIFWVTGLLPHAYDTAWHHLHHAGLKAAFPDLGYAWAMMLTLVPALAWVMALVVDTNSDGVHSPKAKKQQKSKENRTLARIERTVARQKSKVPVGQEVLVGQVKKQPGLILGLRISGEKPLLTTRKGEVLLTLSDIEKHGLTLGMPNSGKTETLLRLAYMVAKHTKWQVFFLDAKGSLITAKRFLALMKLAGRPNSKMFPHQSFNGWQGSPEAIYSRLLEMIDWSREGDGAYYRDVAKHILVLACQAPVGPPRSAGQLLDRLDLTWLKEQYASDQRELGLDGLKEQDVFGTRVRYQGFFLGLNGLLDGGWSWDATTAGYLLLTMAQKESSACLARFMFEDFVDYCLNRKPQGQKALLIVDEFSAIAEVGGMAAKIERLREYGGSVMLSAQSIEGIGDEREVQRVLAATHLKIIHRLPNPEALVRIAGTELVPEASIQHENGDPTGLGSTRFQHQFKVDPDQVRALSPGLGYAILAGEHEKLQVAQAPEVYAELPPDEQRRWIDALELPTEVRKDDSDQSDEPEYGIGYGRHGLG